MTVFFAVAYLAQGLSCAQFGIIFQPIQSFMLNGLNLEAKDISSYMAFMMLPWVIKPIYGLLADFLPLFGYRRKSYILASNFIASCAFIFMLLSSSLPSILAALLVTALAMAVSTALMVGLAVEAGRENGKVGHYLTVQELGYYSANIAAGFAGGLLCRVFSPLQSLHIAALMAALPPLVVSWLAYKQISEKRSGLNLAGLKETALSLKEALCCNSLRLVAALTLLWSFLPVFGVPLYCYESKVLGFAQDTIGSLNACNAFGMLIGSLFYPKLTSTLSQRQHLCLTGTLVAASTLSFLFLANNTSAYALEFAHGFANIVAILSVYVLAAKTCPKRIEVFVMAILVSLRNLATNAATIAGGQIYATGTKESFELLVFLSALVPLSAVALSALVKVQNKPSDSLLK